MRGLDAVDLAATVAGVPRVTEAEATYILWEQTAWPMADNVHVFRQAVQFFRQQRDEAAHDQG